MWRTRGSPQGMPGLSIQSEWVSGALRINLSGRAESFAAPKERVNVDALQPATMDDLMESRRFMIWLEVLIADGRQE
jgi:hypothetical protein